MNISEYTTKLDELDYLMNDPDASPEPEQVWQVLAVLTRHDLAQGADASHT